MVQASSLQQQLEQKVREIEEAVAGIDEQRATQAPAEGEWCVKEVLSHLTGPEQQSFEAGVKEFLKEEAPVIDLTPGDSYYAGGRPNASVEELLKGVTTQYREMGTWVGHLTEDQLTRKAHMPAFKETPLGEYPTLGLWVGAIINFHLTAHVQQLQALCK